MRKKQTIVLGGALKIFLLLLLISQAKKALPEFNPADIELSKAAYKGKIKEHVNRQVAKGPKAEILRSDSITVNEIPKTGVEYAQEVGEAGSEQVPDIQSVSVPKEPEDNQSPDRKDEAAVPGEKEETPISDDQQRPTVPDEEQEPTSPGEEEPVIPGGGSSPVVPGDKEEPVIPGESEPVEKPEDEEVVEPTPPTGFLVDEEGMIYDFVDAENYVVDEYLTLPSEGCNGIRYGAFLNCDVSVIELKMPSNITNLETGAFVGLSALEWIEAEENINYRSVDGVLYDKALTTFLVFPAGRTGIFWIPEFVKRIEDYAFSETHLYKMDMRDCSEMSIGSKMFGDSTGAGITVRPPRELYSLYEQLFSSYEVVLDGLPK